MAEQQKDAREELRAYLRSFKVPKVEKPAPPKAQSTTKATLLSELTGKTVMFSGTLKAYDRAEATKLVKQLGAHVNSAMSRNVDYLIVPVGVKATNAKIQKAKSFGVALLTEAAFIDILKNKGII